MNKDKIKTVAKYVGVYSVGLAGGAIIGAVGVLVWLGGGLFRF